MEHRYDTWNAIDYNMYDQILCISRTWLIFQYQSHHQIVWCYIIVLLYMNQWSGTIKKFISWHPGNCLNTTGHLM